MAGHQIDVGISRSTYMSHYAFVRMRKRPCVNTFTNLGMRTIKALQVGEHFRNLSKWFKIYNSNCFLFFAPGFGGGVLLKFSKIYFKTMVCGL